MYKRALYAQLAEYYDKIYWWKDYDREVDFLLGVFRRYGVHGKRILEVACGTGNHTKILTSKGYEVTGVDISVDVLRVARRKVKHRATFVQGDMRDIDRAVGGELFDAVICLFSAVSYNVTTGELEKTLGGFYRHLKIGGVVVFDTHFMKKNFVDGFRDEDVFDDGRIIGARLAISKREGDVGEISFTYLIKDGRKTIVLRNDVHRLGLFDAEDFLRVLREAGFGKTAVFADWTFRAAREQKDFRDSVFVGSKSDG